MRYRPWIGITLWVGGIFVSFILYHFGILARDEAMFGAALSIIVPLLWARSC